MYTEAQMEVLNRISQIGIIPVIAIDDAAKAVPLKNGKLIAIYLDQDFGGFAVHLVQK